MIHKSTTVNPIIVHALKAWNNARQTPERLIPLFEGVVGFMFHYDSKLDSEIHVYPGLIEHAHEKDELVFYTIPRFRDYKNEDAFHYVEDCCLVRLIEDTHIPVAEAEDRRVNWVKHYPKWMRLQKKGIFQTFIIPIDDFDGDGGEYMAYFALVFTPSDIVDSFHADLILVKEHKVYYDTVRPVPPFKPYTKSYLLELENDLLRSH